MNRIEKILLGVLCLCGAGLSTSAQVPGIINYQGRVTTGGTNFNGTGLFRFALVNNGATQVYWSNGFNSVSITVNKGLYAVQLGDTNIANMAFLIPAAIFTNNDVRLRVSFDDGVSGLQQLSPDQRITSVGYAMMANSVPDGSITSRQLASNAVTSANLAPGAVTASSIASNSITPAQIASGYGFVPTGGIVLSPTASNPSLTGSGYSLIGTSTPSFFTQMVATASWGIRHTHQTTYFNNKFWLTGGFDGGSFLGDEWFSSNGTAWTQVSPVPWVPRNQHRTVVFNGQLWLMGGEIQHSVYTNDIWSSSNGTNWTLVTNAAPWSVRAGPSVASFNGQLWLMGGRNVAGYTNDVWTTANGTTWTLVTNAAPWGVRFWAGTVVHNGKLWIAGGQGPLAPTNDVWSTSDGTNWTQVLGISPWHERAGFGLESANGQMILFGGNFQSSHTNDVWSSIDGATWSAVTNSAAWGKRSYFSTASVSNHVWLFGGTNPSVSQRDVWRTGELPLQLGSYYLFQKQ